MIDDGLGAAVVVVDVVVVVGTVVVVVVVVVVVDVVVVDVDVVVVDVDVDDVDELVEVEDEDDVDASVGVDAFPVVVGTVVVGEVVEVVCSPTLRDCGDKTKVLGHDRDDFHINCRVDNFTHVDNAPLKDRKEARTLPFGHVPDEAYLSALAVVTQTCPFDFAVHDTLDSPRPQPPDLLVARTTPLLVTQNRVVTPTPLAAWPILPMASPMRNISASPHFRPRRKWERLDGKIVRAKAPTGTRYT